MTTSTARKPAKKKEKSKADRPSKHPWDEIERLFIHGEDREKPERDGSMRTVHEWHTQGDLSKRFKLRREQVSKRFARVGPDGKTVHHRRDDFRRDYKRQLNDNILRVLVGQEIRFRLATLALAELALRQIAHQLSRPQNADSLVKLMTAAKRAQEIGMVALDRPANGPEGGASLGTEDWTLMREIRRGTRSVPELHRGGK